MMYFRYLRYVLRHKWFVFLACCREGLYWRGLVHDLSKFLPSEFIPYARYFFGGGLSKFAESGYYRAGFTGVSAFDFAWHLHQKRNRHHWQWWVLPDAAEVKVLPMPQQYWREMLCDWAGAARAQQSSLSVDAWYAMHREKLCLAPCTRAALERALAKRAFLATKRAKQEITTDAVRILRQRYMKGKPARWADLAAARRCADAAQRRYDALRVYW